MNTQLRLVVVDTSQIQGYIFGSNRLRENIGASHLVACSTEQWALEALPAPSNVDKVGQEYRRNEKSIVDGSGVLTGLAAELVYAGGGNAVALFRDDADVQYFIRQLSRKAAERAPGLRLVFACLPFSWDTALQDGLQQAFARLARKKNEDPASSPLLGLGVTAVCHSTGLPAVGMAPGVLADDGETDPLSVYPASAETLAKLRAAWPPKNGASEADLRLRRALPIPDGEFRYSFPSDFDEMGRSAGDESYLALAHIDGDGMARRLKDVLTQQGADNRRCIEAAWLFSRSVQDAATAALQGSLQALCDRITRDDDGHPVIRHACTVIRDGHKDEVLITKVSLGHRRGKDEWFLPFRPIVLGGDDVTFVCDGRLGLSLVADYLRRFEWETEQRKDALGGRSATACAGIAIVKVHYPFARAYDLAEELCRSAKAFRRQAGCKSCLDWHFAQSGLAGGLRTIRRREYHASWVSPQGRTEGSLVLRPISLGANGRDPMRTWEVFTKGMTAFQGTDWVGRHNKAKDLYAALRHGPPAVEKFLALYAPEADDSLLTGVCSSVSDTRKSGWGIRAPLPGDPLAVQCAYFDALELADRFIPL